MILEQLYLGCLSQASYLVGDEKSARAAVVDPRRDIDDYVREAAERGLKIEHVVLTHFHADFVSGHLELQRLTGAPIYLGAAARAEYEFVAVRDGDGIELGDVRLQFLETPGHTPESICVLVFDTARDADNPHAVLTGDTLFIGDVGRPDLMASVGHTAEELAGQLYDSLHGKLLTLPDATLVYPGHGAGSMCGKQLGKERVSTLGEQKRCNLSLQKASRDEFVRDIVADQPQAPAYFSYSAEVNRKQRSSLDEVLERVLRPLSIDEVNRLRSDGAQVLDVRGAPEYSAAHLIGSTHVGLDGQFASWCGTFLDSDRCIVLVAEAGGEAEAAMRLGRIGFDNIAGYLDGGIEALESRPDLLRHTSRITAEALAERLAGPEPPHVVDVRTDSEWNEKHVIGSIQVPLHQLLDRIAEIPRNNDFVLHCASGYRSSIAASILEQQGFTNFSELTGGYLAWELTDLEA